LRELLCRHWLRTKLLRYLIDTHKHQVIYGPRKRKDGISRSAREVTR
jgi:hypothetical protein